MSILIIYNNDYYKNNNLIHNQLKNVINNNNLNNYKKNIINYFLKK